MSTFTTPRKPGQRRFDHRQSYIYNKLFCTFLTKKKLTLFQRFAEQLFRDVEKMDDAVNCPGDLLSPVKNLSLTEVEHLSELGLASSSLDSVGVAIFIVPTYEDGAPPDSAEWFFKSLAENAVDFRVSKSYLKKMNYAVFGLGNSLYCDNFNKVWLTFCSSRYGL